jgi:hypothetical protein
MKLSEAAVVLADEKDWRLELLGKRNTKSWDVRLIDKRQGRPDDVPLRRVYNLRFNPRAKNFHGISSDILNDYYPTVAMWAFHLVADAICAQEDSRRAS